MKFVIYRTGGGTWYCGIIRPYAATERYSDIGEVSLPPHISILYLAAVIPQRHCIVKRQGFLAYPPPRAFPSFGQWHIAGQIWSLEKDVGKYSNGYCSGFSPDSLGPLYRANIDIFSGTAAFFRKTGLNLGAKQRNMFDFSDGKRYNTFVGYFRKKYGERLQKIVLDAGFTCPNRDGTVGTGGCTYCDNAAFHPGYSTPGKSLMRQMEEGMEFHKGRYRSAEHYLAYFQAYSNTYAPVEKLKSLYLEALSHPAVAGIVIGTRPDCVDERKLDMIAEIAGGKLLPEPDWSRTVGEQIIRRPVVTVEYGIESCHDRTLARINRGHDFACARKAVRMTAERGIDTGAHFIFGLPGETVGMMKDSAEAINSLPLRSVKFHQLQIIKGTGMEREFAEHREDFVEFSMPEYLDFIIDILERLRPGLYIERIAGEVPPRFVNATPWGLVRNFELLRMLDKRLEERGTFQGRLFRA